MTSTTTPAALRSLAIEDFRVGSRYVATIAAEFNHGWTVASAERHESALQVLRGGEWVTPMLVTVTYHNGRSITDEVGTMVAVDA
jgi:hypothetical protein